MKAHNNPDHEEWAARMAKAGERQANDIISLAPKLLLRAYEVASQSKDPSTQNAALLVDPDLNWRVVGWAVNRLPPDIRDVPERWERPLKYQVVQHAEAGVINAAARNGIGTLGLTMVCCWAACSRCAGAIIESGIKRLVTHKQAVDRSPPMWRDEIDLSMQMFEEAGVDVLMYDGSVGGPPVRHSGDLWVP